MKSLSSIIRKLSQTEIDSFRNFLLSHSKSSNNRKLELFNQLATKSSGDRDGSVAQTHRKGSRQSEYQLKKRLQDELYAFLISQHPAKAAGDLQSLEMECHKKLYCFKILFDKGIPSHAHQILDEVLTVAMQNSFYGLYLEALSLKNIYFPLTQSRSSKKIIIETQIRKLEESVSMNLYIRQYLSGAINNLHENDQAFRMSLISELKNFFPDSGSPIDRLLQVNYYFLNNDFSKAHNNLIALTDSATLTTHGKGTQAIVCLELVKACLCMGDYPQAREWLVRAEGALTDLESFRPLLLELQFYIALRCDADSRHLQCVIDLARRTRGIMNNEVMTAKWSFYNLFVQYLKRDFKAVVRLTNSEETSILRNRAWLVQAKLLEVLSIYLLGDSDWLYYKIESLRKLINGTRSMLQRQVHIVTLLKTHLYKRALSHEAFEASLAHIETQFRWHPLGCEPINVCTQIRHIFKTGTPSLRAAEIMP